MNSFWLRFAVFAVALVVNSAVSRAGFVQTNIVSDIPGLAELTDPNLKNPWGMSFSATSPIWVSDQANNTATLYKALPPSLVGSPSGK